MFVYIFGYVNLKHRIWLLSAIICLGLYITSAIQLPLSAILKLNIFSIDWFFNLDIIPIGHIVTKCFVSLAVLSSPLYVLSSIPESISEIIFSSILVVTGISLIWTGGPKVKLL